MDYKVIKNLDERNAKFNGGTEMAKDGKSLRLVGTTTVCDLKGLEKGALIAEDGTSKDFSLKTLYRRSWGKALPGSEAIIPVKKTNKPKKAKKLTEDQRLRAKVRAEKLAAKEERAKRKELRAAFKTKKGKLLSKFNHERLMNEITYTKKKGSRMIQIMDKKIFLRSIINNGDVHLLRLESQSKARTGLFFYNIKSEKYMAFDKEIHKTGYGNKNIQWPKLAA